MIEIAAQNVSVGDLLLVKDDFEEVVDFLHRGEFIVLYTKDVCRVHPHERWYKLRQTITIE